MVWARWHHWSSLRTFVPDPSIWAHLAEGMGPLWGYSKGRKVPRKWYSSVARLSLGVVLLRQSSWNKWSGSAPPPEAAIHIRTAASGIRTLRKGHSHGPRALLSGGLSVQLQKKHSFQDHWHLIISSCIFPWLSCVPTRNKPHFQEDKLKLAKEKKSYLYDKVPLHLEFYLGREHSYVIDSSE